jgi:hypothetical protein
MYPTILNIKPTVDIKYLTNINLNLTSVEEQINEYLTAQDGFEKSFYLSDLVRFVDNLSDVVYTTITYVTTVTVYNEAHKVIRLNGEVTPNSISTVINGHLLEDDGATHLTWNSMTVGSINYTTGFITLDQDFGVSEYEFGFTYADTSNIVLEREMFMKHNNITLGIL